MMDEEVSNIFQDPMFTREVNDVDLVEYDFWIIYLLCISLTINGGL